MHCLGERNLQNKKFFDVGETEIFKHLKVKRLEDYIDFNKIRKAQRPMHEIDGIEIMPYELLCFKIHTI